MNSERIPRSSPLTGMGAHWCHGLTVAEIWSAVQTLPENGILTEGATELFGTPYLAGPTSARKVGRGRHG